MYPRVRGKGTSDEDAQTSAHAFMDTLTYGAELYRDDLNKVSFILSSYQDHLDSVDESPIWWRVPGAARGSTRSLATWV